MFRVGYFVGALIGFGFGGCAAINAPIRPSESWFNYALTLTAFAFVSLCWMYTPKEK